MLYVILYDISDDTRRRRVHEALKDFGIRVQFSVFECDLDAKGMQELIDRIDFEIGENDSCRIYRQCESCRPVVKIIGRGKPYSEPEVLII